MATVMTAPILSDIPRAYTGLVHHPDRMGRWQVWSQGQIISIRPNQLAASADLEAEFSRGRTNHRNPAL